MRILSAILLACLLLLGGCEFLDKRRARLGQPPVTHHYARRAVARATPQPAPHAARSNVPQSAPQAAEPRDASLGIPADQLPPPGLCRVWLPDTPAGQQAAPGPCESVQRKVPGGAWVLFRSQRASNVVAVNVYRSRWPKTVMETRYFDYWTGRLLRVE